jgi:hypothetical protein
MFLTVTVVLLYTAIMTNYLRMDPITISTEELLMNLTQITIGETDTTATRTQILNMNIGSIAKLWNWKGNIERNR